MVKNLTTRAADALDHEAATRTLATYVRSVFCEQCGSDPHCAESIESRTELTVAFVSQYVHATPMILGAVLTAAEEAGVKDELMPVFVAAEDYFLQWADFMPDYLGLVGMVDDAYFTHSLLQLLSESHHIRTGSSLFRFDLVPANSLMRRMIGEPMATALDAAVRGALGLPHVQMARERLVGKVKSVDLQMSHCVTAPQTSDDMDIHLGALAGR